MKGKSNIYDLENYTYETKCRRCNTTEDWHFTKRTDFTYAEFRFAMDDHLQNPRLKDCRKCKKPTIQDIISYSEPL